MSLDIYTNSNYMIQRVMLANKDNKDKRKNSAKHEVQCLFYIFFFVIMIHIICIMYLRFKYLKINITGKSIYIFMTA